jgi:hypothetical protein
MAATKSGGPMPIYRVYHCLKCFVTVGGFMRSRKKCLICGGKVKEVK